MRVQYAPPSAQQPRPRPDDPTPAYLAIRDGQPIGTADVVVTVRVEPGDAGPVLAALRLVAATGVVQEQPIARLVRWHADGSAETGVVGVSADREAPLPAEVATAAPRVSVHDLSGCGLGAVSVGRRPGELLAVSVGAPIDEIAQHGRTGLALALRTVVEVRFAFARDAPSACWTSLGALPLRREEK